jgi:hypothetical protein
MAIPPSVGGERRATLPPAADSRMATLPRANETGAVGALRDVGMSASPRVIDVDPISVWPVGMEEDLDKD